MLDNILSKTRRIIPKTIFSFFQPAYHYSLSLLAAIVYGFPSRKIKIIAVTGTKGKSTTTEIINAILEEAGFKTALSNTIRYKVASESTSNKYKMSMPGRFFVQKLISRAVKNKCDYLVLEMTSQGTMQYRHKFIELDALVFTNLSPEHIDSHGSYENYVDAKLQIAQSLEKSSKRPRIIIANKDDVESEKFLNFEIEIKDTFNINEPIPNTELIGTFNKYNILAGIHLARILGIKEEIINKAISNLKEIPGRVQFIDCGQDFSVVVDYAHTTDSLKKLYEAFDGKRKICVLGGTGGGRDNWKRKEMGKIADTFCDEIILTNEDPYDEDPDQIVADVAVGIINKNPKVIMDRREAISEALKLAKSRDVLLITGKGTDPYIMGANNSKIPWSDAEVAREEIDKSLNL
jgi:UDP-N-acetylmuramoyl-L-alanyl-D-glutamate--2,6-diaminopimelate ligase